MKENILDVDSTLSIYHIHVFWNLWFVDLAAAASSSGRATAAATGGDDEEYVPPKPEVENKITEDDAVFTKRYNPSREWMNYTVIKLPFYTNDTLGLVEI